MDVDLQKNEDYNKKMSTLTCIESHIDFENNHYGCFVIEPLEFGHGITLGNVLRRTLLSDLSGFAIVGVRINDLRHELESIRGLREDILELLFNIKEIVFRAPLRLGKTNSQEIQGYLKVKGPKILTAGLIELPKKKIQILNPTHYLGTLLNLTEFYMEIDIAHGIGYQLTDEKKKQNLVEPLSEKGSTLLVDALFMPVRRVNYKIKLIYDTQGNLKESLLFEIWTNGSISPKRSLQEALKILMNLFYPLFLTNQFFTLSEQIKNKTLYKKKKL